MATKPYQETAVRYGYLIRSYLERGTDNASYHIAGGYFMWKANMIKLNNKFKFLTVISIVFLLFIGGYVFTKTNRSKSVVNQAVYVPTKVEQETPRYLVTITNNGRFNFNVEIKNLLVTPFMTGLVFDDCKFIDNKGNEYNGSMPTNSPIRFSKGLFPGEMIEADFNVSFIALSGGGGMTRGRKSEAIDTPKCAYDSNGNYKCVPIEGLKFKECTVYTSTTEKLDVGFSLDRPFSMLVNFPQ